MLLELSRSDLLQLSSRAGVVPPPSAALLLIEGLLAHDFDQFCPQLRRPVVHVTGAEVISKAVVVPGERCGCDVAAESLQRFPSRYRLMRQHCVHGSPQMGSHRLGRGVEQIIAVRDEGRVCTKMPVLVQAKELVTLVFTNELEVLVGCGQQLPLELLQLVDLVVIDGCVDLGAVFLRLRVPLIGEEAKLFDEIRCDGDPDGDECRAVGTAAVGSDGLVDVAARVGRSHLVSDVFQCANAHPFVQLQL